MFTLLQALGNWRVPVSVENHLAHADVVLTHEFGDQHTPSATTRQMVEVAVELCKKYKRPLICQHPGEEVAQELRITPAAVISQHLLKPGSYLDTEEVNRQAAKICERNNWKWVILSTHPHHLWRAGRNLKRQGVHVLYPNVSSVWYDKKCTRPALRTPWKFVPREVYARYIYWKRGWI